MKSNFSDVAVAVLLRWFADYGLSLCAVDYVLPESPESGCPFAELLRRRRDC